MSYGMYKKFSYLQAEIEAFQEDYQGLSEMVQKQQAEILELKSYQEEHQGLSAKVQEQQAEIQELKCGLQTMTEDLLHAKNLQAISQENSLLTKKQISLKKKLLKADEVYEAPLSAPATSSGIFCPVQRVRYQG